MPRKRSDTVTPKMQGVLDFIQACSAQGFSPTLRQIADKMEWSSLATAHGVVQDLRRRKLLKPRRKRWERALKLTIPAPETP